MDVRPDPTPEEAAAIAAAVHIAWPGGDVPPPEETPRWRFAGRWWTQPIPLRRDRPW